MNLADIESSVSDLDFSKGFDFVYDLLLAYDLPKSGVTLLRKGTRDLLPDSPNEHLWKERVYYRFVGDAESDLHSLIDSAQNDEKVTRARPRFLVVRNADRLLAVDARTETTLDIPLADLPIHSAFFMPWAGIEKTRLESLNYADVKAAEKMARLYDEIAKHNAIEGEQNVRNLNVFFSRLLFCFFAEDTRVFEEGSFTDAIASLTQADGSDTATLLDQLFEVLDTDPGDRARTAAHFQRFGYVNGRLFADRVPAPRFSAKARRIILECGTLDWSQINPDIFGSMIQAVVQPSQREGLGMHYTSVENIMRVIRPLFLDDLQERFDRADTVRKLDRLLEHICEIKIFDPACGSGNFLVIAYKELRKLEHRILQRLGDLDPNKAGLFKLSGIKLDHFFGIEIDDFAHEIAVLSLWLAKHQMNVEFHELFGVEISLIPLKDTGEILCGNAARVEWEAVCPKDDEAPVFVLGNPPYLGARMQRAEHKADFESHFGTSGYARDLDYISLWFLKGAAYIRDGRASLGFVSTNSLCQGAHVGLLWPEILACGVEIAFARTSFPWSNNARGNAGVTCVIVGLEVNSSKVKRLFDGEVERRAAHLNPYLVVSGNDTIVRRHREPVSGRPKMAFGSRPIDNGNLVLTRTERDELVATNPEIAHLVKPYIGANEFIKGIERYCLWITDSQAETACKVPALATRVASVATFRSGSSDAGTRKAASRPHSFAIPSHEDKQAVVVPAVSSERRDYVPMGFLPSGTVASNQLYAIYGAQPWLYGLLQSCMHMAWLEIVGGRMKSDYRYSNSLVYNTFPFPTMDRAAEAGLAQRAFGILEAREQFPDQSLADLYDPDKMPDLLRRAHQDLDSTVDSLYRKKPFESDLERFELLLTMYEASIRSGLEGVAHAQPR